LFLLVKKDAIEKSSIRKEKSENLIRLPKSKSQEIEGIHEKLEKSLSGGKKTKNLCFR
jgi:hypothetical protein